MKTLTAFMLVALVAGCGVDGAPTAPKAPEAKPASGSGITMSGEARFGVTKTY